MSQHKLKIPIVSTKTFDEREYRLKEIFESLMRESKPSKKPYLVTGEIGILLAKFEINRYYSNPVDPDLFTKQLLSLISRLNDNPSNIYHTFANGVSGVFKAIDFLNDRKLINFKSIDLIDESVKNYLISSLKIEMDKNNFDYFHGALGVLFFLQDHFMIDVAPFFEKIFFPSGKYQIPITKKENPHIFDLGLAHGLPSFISIICKSNFDLTQKHRLIDPLIEKLLESKLTNSNSLFPYFYDPANKQNSHSRLAWCYGDLSLAVSIYNWSRCSSDSQLKSFALQIIDHSSVRRDLEKNGVIDAGFCHGTAGIAQLFRRMFIETQFDRYNLAHNYWIEKTVELGYFNNGVAGYKSWKGKRFVNDLSLLEGVAGIGLALMSSLSEDEKDSDWDKLFLLS